MRRREGIFVQIGKDVLWVMEDVVLVTNAMKNRHQATVVGACHDVLVGVGANIALFHAGKKAIQLGVKIFAIAFAQGKTNGKAEDAVNFGGYAGIEQGAEIAFGVVNKRQKRREPYHGGDAGIAQGVEGANAF